MAIGDIFVNDIVRFEGTVKDQDSAVVDVSGASVKNVVFRNFANGKVYVQAGTLTNAGTDGKIEYTTINTDLDVGGQWKWQINVVGPGYENSTDIKTFRVLGKLGRDRN